MSVADRILERCVLPPLPADVTGCVALMALENLRYSDWRVLNAVLDAAQRNRARRFRFEEDRQAFVAAHALLRVLVAHTLAAPPEKIEIACVEGRPPDLLIPKGTGMHLSLAHTRHCVAAIVCREAACGIDIECLSSQAAGNGRDPAYCDHGSFIAGWCAQEAHFKAGGSYVGSAASSPVQESGVTGRNFIWNGHQVAIATHVVRANDSMSP